MKIRTVRREGSFPPLSREAKNTILRWLKFSDSSLLYNDARQKYTDATGEWFIKGEFGDWISTPNSFFWLSGKAGCGKTILSSTIVREVERQRLGTLAYFYFSFRRTESQGLRNVINSILTQLVHGLTRNDINFPELFHVPWPFQQLYDSTVIDSEPNMDNLKKTLLAVLAESPATYIIVDALDECPSRKDRSEILDFLMEISLSHSANTHILVTSRREEDIASAIRRLSLLSVIHVIPLQNPEVAGDIKRHVQICINGDREYETWSPALKEVVIEDLSSRADGVFKWVECQLATLITKIRESDVLKALKELPKDLDETYARMLWQISASGYANECHAILQWLAFSRRPLRLTEIAEAAVFAYEDMLSPWGERCLTFDPNKRFPHLSALRSLLSQLVTVTSRSSALSRVDSNPDHDMEISFSHFSVQEYLICDRVDPAFKIDAALAHRFILESCVFYILHCFSTSSDFLTLDRPTYALLDYACQFWPMHADDACLAITEAMHVKDLTSELFRDDGIRFVETLKIISLTQKPALKFFISGDEYASPAWFSSSMQCVYPLRLFQQDDTLDPGLGKMLHGVSSLHVACATGDEAVVVALIELGANIEELDEKQRIPLHCAAAAGHDTVVQLLLDRGSSATATDEDEETPLHRAVRESRESTVDLLANWKGGTSLETRDVYGLTPLHLALRVAQWLGSPGNAVVKTLLNAGANLKTQTWSGLTAFEEVAKYRGDVTTQSDLDDTLKAAEPSYLEWSTLTRALSKAIWSQTRSLGPSIYMNAYTYVHNYCTSSKALFGDDLPAQSESARRNMNRRSAHLRGEPIYLNIQRYLKEQMIEIRAAAARKTSSELPRFYCREWKRFEVAANQISRLCRFLERHWIKRETDEGKMVYVVEDLCKAEWRLEFLEQEPRIAQYVLENLEAQRDEGSAELAYVKSILFESFPTLDILFEEHMQRPGRLYRSTFEIPFLESSKTLYSIKVKEYSEGLDISRYLCEVETLLDGQTTRLREHVEHGTIEKMSEMAVTTFILEPFAKLRDEIEKLDEAQRADSLMRAHDLLSRIHLPRLPPPDENKTLESLCEVVREKKEELERTRQAKEEQRKRIESSHAAIEETLSQLSSLVSTSSPLEKQTLQPTYRLLKDQLKGLAEVLGLSEEDAEQRLRFFHKFVIEEPLSPRQESSEGYQRYLQRIVERLRKHVEGAKEKI